MVVVGRMWACSARKRREAVLPPWERPRERPVRRARVLARVRRVGKGVERRWGQGCGCWEGCGGVGDGEGSMVEVVGRRIGEMELCAHGV